MDIGYWMYQVSTWITWVWDLITTGLCVLVLGILVLLVGSGEGGEEYERGYQDGIRNRR